LIFGEALIDEYPGAHAEAGAPLHVAVHLAARGWEAHLVTRLGRDADGDRIQALLEQYGVAPALVERDDALPTGRVTIELTQDGRAHGFTIHRPAAWDAIAGPPTIPSNDVLYYGSLAGRDERSRATLSRLIGWSNAPLRVFDINLRPPDIVPEVLRMGLARATLLKLSTDELVEAAAALEIPADAAAYFDAGPDLRRICVTRGPEGAEIIARTGERWSVCAKAVAVVDTVGAGDAFTAGLIDALAHGGGERAALETGRDNAADVLGRRGGLPSPTPP
jgi:fructokinase